MLLPFISGYVVFISGYVAFQRFGHKTKTAKTIIQFQPGPALDIQVYCEKVFFSSIYLVSKCLLSCIVHEISLILVLSKQKQTYIIGPMGKSTSFFTRKKKIIKTNGWFVYVDVHIFHGYVSKNQWAASVSVSGYFPFPRNRRFRVGLTPRRSKISQSPRWLEMEIGGKRSRYPKLPKTDGFGKSYTLHGYPMLLF